MKSCEKFELIISNLCDGGELDSNQQNELNTHLTICSNCSSFKLSLEASRKSLRYLPTQQLSIDIDRSLFQKSNVADKPTFWQRKVAVPIPIIAATLILFMSGWGMYLSNKTENINLPVQKEQSKIKHVQIFRLDAVSAKIVDNQQSIDSTDVEKI